MSPIRIVTTEERRRPCAELREQVNVSPDLKIAGQASDEKEVIAVVGRLAPDILILDIDLFGLGGLELLQVIRWSSPNTKTIVLSSHTEEATIRDAIELGARGYIVKTDHVPMDRAIRAVQQGEVWARRQMIAEMIEEMITLNEWPPPSGESTWAVA